MPGHKILVIDDEPTICLVLKTLLTGLGFDTVTAGSAEDGLARISGERFALAMVDIVLPGMNGIEFLKRARELSPDTEVLVMTSHASVDTAIEAIRHGAYDYFHKPFEIDDVAAAVARVLERHDLAARNKELLNEVLERNRDLTAAVKRLDSLNRAGQVMSSINALPELLDYLVMLVAAELQAERTSLMLIDDTTGELFIAASCGIAPDVVESTRVKPGEGVAGQVMLTGTPILVSDVFDDLRVPQPPRMDGGGTFVSLPLVIGVPIRGAHKILGVINVTGRTVPEPFDGDDMAYLGGLAGQAAVAIERARHSERLREALLSLQATQDQVVASARIGALGKMAAGVAHDFNNLLNGLLGRCQLLLRGHESGRLNPETLLSGLHEMEALSLQASGAVRRLQDYSRIRQEGVEESCDLGAATRLAVDLTRPRWKDEPEATGHPVEVALSLPPVPPIPGGPTDICQAISNLIFNAVEAMPGGGRLTLRTFERDGLVCVSVSDSGIGMSPEAKKRLFEPFFTTKESGHGLGTSIVYGIVTRLKGSIDVESAQGKGTTITLQFPPARVEQPAAEPPAAKSATVSGPKRVLFVDDEPQNLKFYREALKFEGIESVLCSSGPEALEELERGTFDLVVTDLSMPVMSGWELCRAVKARRPDLPVILLSGWGGQQDAQNIADAGVDMVLEKPIQLDELLASLRAAMQLGAHGRKTRGDSGGEHGHQAA